MKKVFFILISTAVLLPGISLYAADKVVVIPLSANMNCYPCYPTEPCYTFAPETRNIGQCADGKFLLNATSHTCSCVEDQGPSEEYCNNLDDDCDGQTDEGDVCLCDVDEEREEMCGEYNLVDICTGILDEGYIHCCGTTDPEDKVYACVRGVGRDFKLDILDADDDSYSIPQDCDDNNPDVHPDIPEICNTIDDNCDYIIDERCP